MGFKMASSSLLETMVTMIIKKQQAGYAKED
jgi:hypothetical protein